MGIKITPSFFDLKAKSGEEITFKIEIENNGEPNINISPAFFNAQYNTNPAKGINISNAELLPAASWFSYDPTQNLEIKEGEKAEVEIKINVPQNAIGGGYYQLVTFDFGKLESQDIGVQGTVAATVYLDIEGEERSENFNIENFSTSEKIYFTPKAQFNSAIKNTGNVHLFPRGNITIWDTKDKKQSNQIILNDKVFTLLPQQKLREYFEWKDDTINNFLLPPIGKYSAVLEVKAIDTNIQPKTAVAEFYVFPYQYLFYIIILAILIFDISRRITKHFKTNNSQSR